MSVYQFDTHRPYPVFLGHTFIWWNGCQPDNINNAKGFAAPSSASSGHGSSEELVSSPPPRPFRPSPRPQTGGVFCHPFTVELPLEQPSPLGGYTSLHVLKLLLYTFPWALRLMFFISSFSFPFLLCHFFSPSSMLNLNLLYQEISSFILWALYKH